MDFPDELILEVLRYASHPVLLSFSLTSRRFLRTCRQHLFYEVDLASAIAPQDMTLVPPEDRVDDADEKILARFESLRDFLAEHPHYGDFTCVLHLRFSMASLERFDAAALLPVLCCFKKVEHLTISDCDQYRHRSNPGPWDALHDLLLHSPLRSLQLANVSGLKPGEYPNLEAISFFQSIALWDDDLDGWDTEDGDGDSADVDRSSGDEGRVGGETSRADRRPPFSRSRPRWLSIDSSRSYQVLNVMYSGCDFSKVEYLYYAPKNHPRDEAQYLAVLPYVLLQLTSLKSMTWVPVSWNMVMFAALELPPTLMTFGLDVSRLELSVEGFKPDYLPRALRNLPQWCPIKPRLTITVFAPWMVHYNTEDNRLLLGQLEDIILDKFERVEWITVFWDVQPEKQAVKYATRAHKHLHVDIEAAMPRLAGSGKLATSTLNYRYADARYTDPIGKKRIVRTVPVPSWPRRELFGI